VSPTDFAFVQELLRREAAIDLEAGKEYLVEARLVPLAAQLGFSGIEALLQAIRSGVRLDLKHSVIEAMDVHETSFFRDWRPFEALRTRLLPHLLEARAGTRELTIWSAACASGQEPYSLAMLLRDSFPELGGWRVRILATDISRAVLQTARAGVYGQLEVNRGLPATLLIKYLDKRGVEWVVRDEIRSMVEFREINLAAAHTWGWLPRADLVLLRNVLIYQDLPTRRRVLAGVREVLRPDGWLLMGGAETTLGIDESFARVPIEGACAFGLRSETGGGS
jgi:chemotaxis protein methyltransferase CheR